MPKGVAGTCSTPPPLWPAQERDDLGHQGRNRADELLAMTLMRLGVVRPG